MQLFERACLRLRHHPWFERADWLWDAVRPYYDQFLALVARNGLKRTINGMETIHLLPSFRGKCETDEPDVWKDLMSEVRQGDIIADVGAFIGLYTIALARRVGAKGRVIAFEPDPENFAALETHVKLNVVSDRVRLMSAAVGAVDGPVPFVTDSGSESHIRFTHPERALENIQMVQCVRLDTIFAGMHLDILKIDVEGSEAEVLRGTVDLLQDARRRPRAIYIEVHPYAWKQLGTSDQSILSLLHRCGYRICDLNGREIERIESYGQIIARARKTSR